MSSVRRMAADRSRALTPANQRQWWAGSDDFSQS